MRTSRTWVELLLIALFWITVQGLSPFAFSVNIQWPEEFWVRQMFFVLLLVGAYWTNLRVLLPRYAAENKYVKYIGTLLVMSLLMLLVLEVFEKQIELPRKMHEAFRPDRPFDPERNRFSFDFISFILILLNFSIGVIVFLIRRNQSESEKREELEKLQISTELSYLKSQINPHFFFNTLNNIYALTTIDSEASRNAILKLSSMMRYVISGSHESRSSLPDEVKFIENYIDLMKLRLSNRVKVTFKRPEHPEDLDMPPMLLQPFVENAFKHGVSASEPSHIDISISTEGDTLKFLVVNNIVPSPEFAIEEHGIGISNTRRRLELLYPSSHELKIENDGTTFTVSLTLNL